LKLLSDRAYKIRPHRWTHLVERIGRTSAQPEAVLIRNGDGTFVCRNRAIIKGDTGTESPVFIVVVGGTQRDTISILEAFIFIEQRLTIAAGRFQLLELAPAGIGRL
jgi:hypothetical protein